AETLQASAVDILFPGLKCIYLFAFLSHPIPEGLREVTTIKNRMQRAHIKSSSNVCNIFLCRIKTVYCMNEAELVDTALCILAENCKVEETEVTSSEEEAHDCLNVSACSSCSSANGSNAATMTTVGAKSPKRLEDLGCSEKVKSGDDEDDALKYVREIFFT
uniref:Uncharacterized protein n=1 Tax=Salvator merianae TaxID=96440 RepID=A0A8D0C7C9_SALMN